MFNKEDLKKLLDLNETFVVAQLAGKLKPYAKLIYVIGSAILALAVLGSLVMLLGSFSAGLISLALVFVQFVILRMFCEFLTTYQE